jgi:hypothetical protein
VQFHRFAVDAHVRDASAGRDNGLADSEGSRKPDRFYATSTPAPSVSSIT